MAKNAVGGQTLSFVDIVMHADAETIKAAYEARVKVDGLLAEREEAYRKIAELEQKVDAIIGEPGVFAFPEPPLPVSGFGAKAPSAPAKRPVAAKAAKAESSAAEPESSEDEGRES